MAVTLRPTRTPDAVELGGILYRAFATLAERHNFPRDFPSPEVGAEVVATLIAHPGFYGVAAEENGRLAGSNFIDLRSPVAGIGPISVDPDAQNAGIGRRLMRAVIDEAVSRDAAGIRLVQAAYHNRSMSLYTKLGFVTREPLSLLQGTPPGEGFPGYEVAAATATSWTPATGCAGRSTGLRARAKSRKRSMPGTRASSCTRGASPATRRKLVFAATPSPRRTAT